MDIYREAVSRASHDMRQTCADPESFVRGGPIFFFFLVNEQREDPNTTINGPLLAPPEKRH